MYFVFIIYLQIFGHTASIEPRSVNLALDTVLEFNNRDNADLQIIDNVQSFLYKIKNVLKDKSGRRSSKEHEFTDHVVSFLDILSQYDDDDFEDAVTIIGDELRKYHYAGCRFFELLQNNDMRKFVGQKLNKIREKIPSALRQDVIHLINELKSPQNEVKEFLDYINTLYPQESKDKLQYVINNLELYKSKSKRANLDLIKVIREALRSAVFDHYTNLNVNARKDFKIRLETFWKHFMNPHKVEHKIWNIEDSKSQKKVSGPPNIRVVNKELQEPRTEKKGTYFNFNPLKIFNAVASTTETNVEKFWSKYPTEEVSTPKDLRSDNTINIFKDVFPKLDVILTEDEPTDKNFFGSFKDTTPQNVVKDIEKPISLTLPDISTMVKQKFDSITKEKSSKAKNDLLKDINIEVDDTETTKEPEKVNKHKTKLRDKIKHYTPKKITAYTTERIDTSDSKEVHTIVDTTTKRHKHKTSKKRKEKKHTTRSRIMTLYVEEYTGKVKKIRTKDKTTADHKQYTSWKDLKKQKNKLRKGKSKKHKHTVAFTDEHKKTTKPNKDRHEKSKRKHKSQKKHSQRSETTKKSRKWLKLPTTESYEGMSIESFETKSYRKNIDFDNFQNRTTKHRVNTTQSITTKTEATTTKSTTVTGSSMYGALDFWKGTTKFAKTTQETTTLPNTTKGEIKGTTKLVTTKPTAADFNRTLKKENREITKNETIRLIDLNEKHYLRSSTELPITTKQTEPTTVKTTTQKPSTKTPLRIQRRNIEVTTQKKPTATTTIKASSANSPIPTKPTTPTTKLTFNLGEFLNRSEVLDVEQEKKARIEEKMLKDMETIFSSTTRATTTEPVFTDPFVEMDNALDLK